MNNIARIPVRMTVAEFQQWRPTADLHDRRWQLFDGELLCMSPAGITHGVIQSEAAFLLVSHLCANLR